ncbi:MAG: argininosuccinate synthase [Candidatus Omnitrophota bacterium]
MAKKVVLAYSGGLDTSVCVSWLKNKGYEVIALLIDLGQDEDFKAIKRRAQISGASKIYIKEVKQEFIREYIWPALKANAIYEGKYMLATALGRPLIAKHLVAVAQKEQAEFVAHGCTGKGNDQVRIEVSIQALDAKMKVLAPVREWEFKSRDAEIAYLEKNNIKINVSHKKPYSLDKNLWGVSIECGVLEDPWSEPPEDAYQMTANSHNAPKMPKYVEIGFEQGIPVSINNRKIPAEKLIAEINKIAAQYRIGRSDLVENRLVGIKSREIYEAPAATVLYSAHKELESLVLDREILHFKEQVALKYAELIYYGLWFTPLKQALDKFIDYTQHKVTGIVRVKLSANQCAPVGRKSPHSLYNKRLATYSAEDEFDQKLAKGFIDLWALPYKK